mmetsp:Transcript_14678/g.44008  ORF Transcript_14678/g.44008 Transcript_14678/m.44008 type:complete len:307 (+) Transcript_14678:435-1355(+)
MPMATHIFLTSEAHGDPHLPDIVLHEQRDRGERRAAHEVDREAGPQAQDPALLHDLRGAVDGTLEGQLPLGIGLHLLDLGLHEVEGQREVRPGEATDEGAAEHLRGVTAAHALQLLLRLRVEAEHAEVQGHRAGGGRLPALEAARGALLLHDAGDGVDGVPVATPLGLGQHGVSLHADQGEVGRVAGNRREAAGGQRAAGRLHEGRLLARLHHPGGEGVVEGQARARVEHLPEVACAHAAIEALGALLGEHLLGDRERAGAAALGGAQLDPHLHHVDGLDGGGGHAAGQAAGDERLAGVPHVTHLS